jgi:hypothetical protein
MDGMLGDPHGRTGVLAIGMGAIPPPAHARQIRNDPRARWFPERRSVADRIGLAARAALVSVTILVSAATAWFQAYRPPLRGDLQRHDVDVRVEGASSPMARWASERRIEELKTAAGLARG